MSADTQRPIRRGIQLRTAVAAAVTAAVTAGTLAVLPGGGSGQDQRPVAVDRPTVTEQQAMTVARDSGKATEVVGARTERREIFAEPDGTFTAREYTEPVRTVQGGKWVPVDATLVDKAARFDGTPEAYLDASETVLDTAKSFSVSAWVRPTVLDKDMTIVSQDGTGEPGFTFGYDAAAQTWKFAVPVNDVDSLGEWKAVSTGVTPVKDQWVLLTGVYDAQKSTGPQLQLYINKDLKGSATRRSTWKSYGPLQIGRTTAKSGYRANFTGDLAEVRVFDRVLPAAQVAELMTVKPERKAYWQLDDATGTASAETGGGQALTLAGNASVYRPADPLFDTAALVGDGNLVLDGDGDYAATATVPVTGNTSFTVTARAQLTSLDPEKSQTVLSLPGASANRLQMRYQAATRQWELALAKTDAAAPELVTFTDDQELPDTGGSGQHLAVVYDAFANSVRLYVEGRLVAGAYGTDDTLWSATGGLQVGRSLRGASEYFAGAIDEVRVYSGAADQISVQQMAALTALPDM